jgi:xanthine/CO dehydrogenase XdhC/CoxF family maturation factor
MKELQAIVAALLAPTAGPAVLATLVQVQGSSYRRPGARLLLTADGRRLGSISGGCLEEDVAARAARVRETGEPEAVVYDTTSENDQVWGVGLGCHGVVRVLLERLPAQPGWAQRLAANLRSRQPTRLAVRHKGDDRHGWGTVLADATVPAPGQDVFLQTIAPPTALAIFGAGDDAAPLVGLAKELGWHVTVADPRAAFATAARFPAADACVVAPAGQLVERVAPDAATLAVVMTHHYVHDLPLLRALLQRPLAYLGLLGPRRRAEKILADLGREGVPISPEQRARLHAPVGLDLGAETPAEVALAIVAEMQATLGRRNARPLRERSGPIHEDFAAQNP